jgi:hypothetical protein
MGMARSDLRFLCIFTYWAFYALRGKRPLLISASAKNVPKFLLKARYVDLWNRALTWPEKDYLSEEQEKKELIAVLAQAGVKKALNDKLFNARNKKSKSHVSKYEVEDLLGSDEILAQTEYIEAKGVRDLGEGEKDLMGKRSKTGDGKKAEVVFEARSIGNHSIDDLQSIYDLYADWLDKHNAKKWNEE